MAQADTGVCPSISEGLNSTYTSQSDWWNEAEAPLCGFNSREQIYVSNITDCCEPHTVGSLDGCFYFCQPLSGSDQTAFGRCVRDGIGQELELVGIGCNDAYESAAAASTGAGAVTLLWILAICFAAVWR
ncbi:uncharacterized protein MYCFIDRAFT_78755 [Pseudocercospora fijiensis CIRAD86]|uniref:Uncharacterized protein n=1 Tax=Pseudocercospora fijiensis (strain CIRAD86) TaxID=383855 RepID=M3AXJ3_PSEFD|nr:uncharacterized protein MYCFIDRAFT_78755 [Pseudocercospora fijiensis CIRAD86]EME81813.1 hypothetical protein MYCFIDRAFT_78755 [Pseudocercospora fijiensis CIRAD86]